MCKTCFLQNHFILKSQSNGRWNQMIKRNDNETLTEFYINNKDDNDIKVIIEVINSICTSHYGNSTPEFNKQISDFVTEFKKENLHFLFENQMQHKM